MERSVLTLLGGGDHEDHDKDNRKGLDGDAPSHHLVTVFTVEFAAFGHGNQAKDQDADDGDHRDQQKDEKSGHAVIISFDRACDERGGVAALRHVWRGGAEFLT